MKIDDKLIFELARLAKLNFDEERAKAVLLDVAKGCQAWVSKKTI